MTHKYVSAHDKLREKALSDLETRAMYEALDVAVAWMKAK